MKAVPRSRWTTRSKQSQTHDHRSGGKKRQRPQAERQTIGKVGGQVDDQKKFERLGWLEVDAAASQPGFFITATRVRAKDKREGSEQQAAGQPDIFVAAQEIAIPERGAGRTRKPAHKPTARRSGEDQNQARDDRWSECPNRSAGRPKARSRGRHREYGDWSGGAANRKTITQMPNPNQCDQRYSTAHERARAAGARVRMSE